MEGAPKWKAKEIILDDAPEEPQILFYRDLEECCDHIQGNPSFSDAWDTAPKKVKYYGTETCVYHDPLALQTYGGHTRCILKFKFSSSANSSNG